ncbi:MAG: major capsid protein [bacterium]|nr:major capsid protein [bacterium]
MANQTTKPADTKFQDPFSLAGYKERLNQNLDVFNGQSAGTIVLTTERKHGDFDHEAFIKGSPGAIARQDQDVLVPVDDGKLTMEVSTGVKLNRQILPKTWTLSSTRKPGFSMDIFRFEAGAQAAEQVVEEMLNTSLSGLRTALVGQASNSYVVPTSGVLNTDALAIALSKMGDRASRVKAWAMHSKTYWDLVRGQALPSVHGDQVAGAIVYGASPASYGRPIVVTDAEAGLVDGTDYFTLGLTEGAVTAEETEDMFITVTDPITGYNQIFFRMQGEYAFNLKLKGFSYDTTVGKNPVASAVAASNSWKKIVASSKDLAGVVIKSK